MRFKSLFAFIDTPDFNALFRQPFNDERCFIGFSAESVEHKYQQYIEKTFFSVFFDKLYFISFFGTNFKAGYTVFLFFTNNPPSHFVSKFPAGFSLHRYICCVLLIIIDMHHQHAVSQQGRVPSILLPVLQQKIFIGVVFVDDFESLPFRRVRGSQADGARLG